MIRITASLLFLALGAAAAFAAPPPPTPLHRLPEYEASLRGITRAGKFEPFADLTERWQFESRRPYKALMLGSYVRVHKNLKLGAFYRVQNGARHDDDWINNGAGLWFWRPSTNRPENVLILDATPRVNLGGHFTGALKVRCEHNFFNGQRTLKLEPELAWFWFDGLSPKATVFLRHGTYIPLNFGAGPYYERWWYLAGLGHFGGGVSAGPSVALRDTVWSTSGPFRSATGGSYRVVYRAVVWGFTVLIRAL